MRESMSAPADTPPSRSPANHAEGLPSLGLRLRHARLVARLTLKQVATLAGCSESLVSKLEHDAASPSLATLHRLASVLDTNISELTAEHWDEDLPVLPAAQRSAKSFTRRNKAGGIQLEALTKAQKGGLLQGNIHIVAPGVASDGLIEHPGEEMGYVLQGSIEMTIGDKVYALETGDAFHFPSNLPHGYHNKGTVEARILWVNTPVTF